jgi:hypothetical protein
VADFDVVSDIMNLPIITPYRGPGFRWIVLVGVLIDVMRKRYRLTIGVSIKKILAHDRENNSEKYKGV